jgi:hypothetical protein
MVPRTDHVVMDARDDHGEPTAGHNGSAKKWAFGRAGLPQPATGGLATTRRGRYVTV